MIYTSYFAKMRKMTPDQKARCVSIARFTPRGVDVPGYLSLAPAKDLLLRYKKDGDKQAYTEEYNAYLDTLDAAKVAEDLENKILCCYEKSTDFCHRHLVAKWLNENGYACEELKI